MKIFLVQSTRLNVKIFVCVIKMRTSLTSLWKLYTYIFYENNGVSLHNTHVIFLVLLMN